MRVGIDARVLERTDDLRGIAVLVSHVVRHLTSEGVEVTLFSARPLPNGAASGARQVVLRSVPGMIRRRVGEAQLSRSSAATALRPLLNILWEQFLLPRALARERLDLYHAPANVGIPVLGRGVFIGTINDVIPMVTPYFFDSRPDPVLTTWVYRLWYRISLMVVTWKARRILTLSESSCRDIERLFPWARGKVTVIYPGPDPRYRRVEDAGVIDSTLAKYRIGKPFLLYVGGVGQRKNLAGLLRAYAIILSRLPDAPPLVVVGKHNALYDRLRRLAVELGIVERVSFPGFIPSEDMPALLSSAEMLIYPSFYEGFGLPVVEAMACGCPVVCSGNSSLPEVGGDAAMYCDPNAPGDIADKMERVLVDGVLRARLIERGLSRACDFSIERMSAEVLRVYHEVLDVTAARRFRKGPS